MGAGPAPAEPPGPSAGRLISVVEAAFPIGSTQAILRRFDGSAASVPRKWLAVLERCRGAKVAEEHVEAVRVELGLPPEQAPELKRAIDGLFAAGALASFDELLATRKPDPDVPPGITTFVVATCDRPALLDRCLRSWARNVREHGRLVEWVVGDDSHDATSRARTRDLLRSFAQDERVAVRFLGAEERERLCHDLAEASGVPIDVVAFGVRGALNGRRVGANHNALNLDAIGECLLSVDDDTLGVTARHPAWRNGVAFTGDRDPTEFRFYPDRASAFADVKVEPLDVVGEHEALLGRGVGELAGSPGVSVSSAGRDLARVLGCGAGRIAVTWNGWAGDSAMEFAGNLVQAVGPTRDRLVRSQSEYEAAFRSREVLRGTRVTTVHRSYPFFGMFSALDATRPFPPFLPSGRNSDGVFGLTLLRCFPDSYFASLPFVAFHDPAEPRAYSGDRRNDVESFRLSELVIHCTLQTALPSPHPDWRTSLAEVGRSMLAAASTSQEEFDRYVVERMSRHAVAMAEQLRKQLERYDREPRYWAEDAEARIGALGRRLLEDDYFVPRDVDGSSLEERRLRTREVVGQWGRLLVAWPSILDAARDLRRAGKRSSTSL